jgi:CRP/FNR family transcriptional regulator, cyclic AMP receptor protein
MSGGGHVTSALSQCPLFYGRPIHALVPTCSTHRYPAGTAVFDAGERAGHLVVLAAGRVQTHALRANGDVAPIRARRAPDAVVEVGVFATDRTRRVGATAVTDVEAVLVPRDALIRAAADDAVLAERLLTAIADIASPFEPSSADVAQRVLGSLRRLADTFGVRQPDGSVLVGLRVSHTELGAVVAASRQEVGIALKALEAAGDIERLGDYYLVTGASA